MKRIFILAFLLAWLTAQFAAAAAVDTLAVRSASMDRDIPVIVILPDGASPANPCPTVYLLHGYGGNQTTWLRIKPSLPAIADREGIAFVCPDGATSWYLDSKVRAKSLYETFMTRELLPAVEERYPVSRDRSGRAITGLSMGGFGAVSLAIRHKELFGAVGSTSGGLDIRPFPENWEIPQLLGTQAEHPEAWEAATPINPDPAYRRRRSGDRYRLRLRRFLLRGEQRLPCRAAAPRHHARLLCASRPSQQRVLGQFDRLPDRIFRNFFFRDK